MNHDSTWETQVEPKYGHNNYDHPNNNHYHHYNNPSYNSPASSTKTAQA